MCFLSSKTCSGQICSAFEWEARHLSLVTHTVLRLVWIDETLATTLLVKQWANVAGKEAYQALNEIDFNHATRCLKTLYKSKLLQDIEESILAAWALFVRIVVYFLRFRIQLSNAPFEMWTMVSQ